MIVDEGLILSRFVHYAALLFTFGVCFFPIYAFSGNDRQGRLDYWNKSRSGVLVASLIGLASGSSGCSLLRHRWRARFPRP